MRHYTDLIIRAESRGEAGTLMSEAFARLHGVITEVGAGRIAVAFPNLQQGERPHPGNVLRVFGSEADLESVQSARGLQHLEKAGGLVRGKVLPVPADHGWARFVRDRSAEKTTPQAIERSEARFIQRYYQEHGKEPTRAELEKRRQALRKRSGRPLPFLRLRSRSNGGLFSLNIRREAPGEEAPEGEGFTVYGLAPAGGPGVPDFPTAEPFL
jgi:CRISPR-associated endoribonuclease Cas6/Csy4 subtype I-F